MRETNKILRSNQYTIKFFDEKNSSGKSLSYSKSYLAESEYQLTSIYGIQVFKNDQLVSDCLIGAEGGSTGIYSNSLLIKDDKILICCADSIFKLNIPTLNLDWKMQVDEITCFSIYPLEEDFLVHGELSLSRLNSDGEIIWQSGSSDIWVTLDIEENVIIQENKILATDFEYLTSEIDFDGNLITKYYTKKSTQLNSSENYSTKWWEFWK